MRAVVADEFDVRPTGDGCILACSYDLTTTFPIDDHRGSFCIEFLIVDKRFDCDVDIQFCDANSPAC